jgi:hypothetical protein
LKSGLKYAEDDCSPLSMDCPMREYSRVLPSTSSRLAETMAATLRLSATEPAMASCFSFSMRISVKYHSSDNAPTASSTIPADTPLPASSLVSSPCGSNDNGLSNPHPLDHGAETGTFACPF